MAHWRLWRRQLGSGGSGEKKKAKGKSKKAKVLRRRSSPQAYRMPASCRLGADVDGRGRLDIGAGLSYKSALAGRGENKAKGKSKKAKGKSIAAAVVAAVFELPASCRLGADVEGRGRLDIGAGLSYKRRWSSDAIMPPETGLAS